ncbi:FAD-dependent oxidoreductase [Nocardia caishijiensis]|uniref:Glycine/D-amino acid oxidase-like deaminating enzyme n=1 Tax=Nocardia caishijiensis TaxID=184756 RepID=A0ABQ6YNK3_9NOCA|nr:FAD-dependent oxidoreductase [Nocardia caishijiensis]KAF0847378.1 glycine/D-amino acid oxidase-like deaminating enzyme [Nocardia caishijiensis]
MTSLWLNNAEVPARLRLTPGSHFDIVVLGAGIVGLTTALLLAQQGREVAVLEAKRVGAGTTAASTAKVSLLQGTRAQTIARRHGIATLSRYLAANLDGFDWLLDFCAGRDLAVERVAAYTYAQNESEMSAVRAEFEATRSAGLPTDLVDDVDVPFPLHGAVRLREQAQLNPMAFLAALAAEVETQGGSIFESTRAQRLRHHDGRVVIGTEHGEVDANNVVVATGTPIFDRGGYFARVTAQRSYLAAFKVPGPVPEEMYISAGQPIRSLRRYPADDVLLVGGSGHEVGREDSAEAHVRDLLDWTGRWFPGAELLHRWSAQDYHPVGELPYVGPLVPGREEVLVATGFAKWGFTNGAAAALALAGRITGDAPKWADTLSAWRLGEVASLPAGARANATVARYLSTGWLHLLGADGHSIPPEGCGRVERHGLAPTAVSTVDGVTTEISAICPHLGGILHWNDAERTWDCPLHGSRFEPDGAVIEGPATHPLSPR